MRQRTVRTIVATLAGAFLGGFFVFFTLVNLGKRPPPAASSLPVPVGTPDKISSPAATGEPSPSPSADQSLVTVETLGVSFRIPQEYRIASTLNAFDDAQSGPKRFTITKATAEQEEQYVKLVKELHARQAVTEAPEFVPGGTMTIAQVGAVPGPEEQLAKAATPWITKSGLQGTRYSQVEGLFLYDVTRVDLGKERVTVSMSYASEEPRFDEEAYQSVLKSLARFESGT